MMVLVAVKFFVFLSFFFFFFFVFFFVVALFDQVHDVEAIHGLC